MSITVRAQNGSSPGLNATLVMLIFRKQQGVPGRRVGLRPLFGHRVSKTSEVVAASSHASPPDVREVLLGYCVAVVATSVAALLRMLADTWTGNDYPLVVFFGAVAAATWYGGYRPGIVSALLSYVIASYLFISPRYDFGLMKTADAIGFILYALSSATIIALVDRLRSAEGDARVLAQNLVHVVEAGDIVGWQWIRPSRTIVLTDNARRILGLERIEVTPLELLRRFAAPDRGPLINALRSAIYGTQRLSAEARFKRPGDKRTIWLRCQAQVSGDRGNSITCLRGVFIDETPRLTAEAALRDAEARFRKSHDASLRGYSLFTSVRGPTGEIVDFTWQYINPAGARLTKRRVSDLVGSSLLTMLPDVPARTDLYERMKHVAETGQAQDVDLYYEMRGVRGWFRNMIVRADDGVAVEFFDITNRTALEEELRQAAAELQLADKRKNEFLALLAHELRNPLAPVRTGVQILSTHVHDASLRSVIQIMERQVLHIVRLIDDLLDLTRIERGKLDLHREKVPLAEIVRRGIEWSEANIETRHHNLIFNLDIPHVYLDVDPTRMAQVISNLLNNAAKFMAPGGRIWVSARKRGAMAEIAVKDEGRGIHASDLDRIFERFVQCTVDVAEPGSGLGLGLALVKNLVELHGGKVTAYSKGAHQGSEFTITLPISIDVPENTPASPQGPPTTSGMEGRRILIVDDDEDTVQILARALSEVSMQVETATDGQQSLAAADGFVPHVMLVDLGMPGLDGFEIARTTREKPWGADVLLVALTGWGQDEDKERALNAGFDYHLTKPVAVQAILEVIAMSERWRTPATEQR